MTSTPIEPVAPVWRNLYRYPGQPRVPGASMPTANDAIDLGRASLRFQEQVIESEIQLSMDNGTSWLTMYYLVNGSPLAQAIPADAFANACDRLANL